MWCVILLCWLVVMVLFECVFVMLFWCVVLCVVVVCVMWYVFDVLCVWSLGVEDVCVV